MTHDIIKIIASTLLLVDDVLPLATQEIINHNQTNASFSTWSKSEMAPKIIIIITFVISSLLAEVSGWSLQSMNQPLPQASSDASLNNRRSFLTNIAIATSSSFFVTTYNPTVVLAAAALSQDAAMAQWKASVITIDNLLTDWDKVYPGGGSQKEVGISGDSIRKELGTANFGKEVSPLFQLDKAFKVLRDTNDDIDIVEFTELSEEFAEVLASADSMAYSSNFAGGSGNPNSNKPTVFIEKSKVEVVRLQQIAKKISSLL